MVTSRDVQEIVSKLSSDKAKAREEGIKLLNTWLEGERSIRFCLYIGRETAKLKPKEIPHSETWPFLVSLLVKCISSEISSSKRRLPKLSFAKTLRIIIQRAEDAKFSGKVLPLLPVVKTLFGHVWDVLSTIPSFQSEYGVILRHLLSVRDYRFHLRNRVYSSLILLYLEKVETGLDAENNCPKEEIFRYILTLHSLLENPPGDFLEDVRDCIVKGFVTIFSFVRDEGKISRKLVECVNMYLLKDGPNLGSEHLEIHNAMRHFVFRFWTTTHDRGLKDALISNAMLQLNLIRGDADDSSLVEQILDVVCKELDQASASSACVLWTDVAKDEKFGSLRGSHCKLVEIAALVLYRACSGMVRALANEKRAKKEPVAAILKEALRKGKWLWHATFCCLVNRYYNRLCKDIFLYWFEGISTSFERILNDAYGVHAYDGLLWTLRSLQELSVVFYMPDSQGVGASFITNEMKCGWQSIWNSLMHGLPLFTNSNIIVDATLMLLGSIVTSASAIRSMQDEAIFMTLMDSCGIVAVLVVGVLCWDQMNSCIASQELWDLNLFKRIPSESALYFIACYFSHRGSQGDLRDSLHVRKNLLQAVLSYFNWKESFVLNEHSVYLLPAAVYALSAGCSPSALCSRGFPQSYFSTDVSDATSWLDENECEKLCELFECSVETLTKMDANAETEGSTSPQFQGVRLPRELRELLLRDMESYVLSALLDKENGNRPLSEVLFICALLTNFVYGSSITRKREDVSGFLSKIGECLTQLLDNAVTSIGKNSEYFGSLGFRGFNSDCELKTTLTASFRSFVCCPMFDKRRKEGALDPVFYATLIQSTEMLLKALTDLYKNYSESLRDPVSEFILLDSSVSGHPSQVSGQVDSNKRTIVDMELDVNEDIRDVRFLSVGGNTATGVSFSEVEWKMGMITLISSVVTVLGAVAWDVLFELLEKECDNKVCEKMLYHLCRHPLSTSSLKIGDLVKLMNDMVEVRVNSKLDCNSVLTAVYHLLRTSSFEDSIKKDGNLPLGKREFEKNLVNLRELVTKVAESGLLGWPGRVRLIDCICHFVSLSPSISQTMIERLFLLLQDPDYRVRFYLAGQIGVLFQTWEGHEELYQDICSSFGVALVIPLKGKIVTAEEVLAAGPQRRPRMETAIITLMHLAFHSEKIELEAVFMMCVISAIDPSTRELVNTALDNLSRNLHYSTRFKYLEQLMASILFCWVSCGVSIVTLVEIRQLFVANAEPSYFTQYICQWLLPALIMQGDNSNMRWLSQVACQSLAALVKKNFVPIFAICMALLCSKESDLDKGALALQSSILQIAAICETERDQLIKKHMVSVVNHILSLTSCASDPAVPYFSKDTVLRAVQRVVDGFLEMDNYPTTVAVVDRINVFRPDRVFMFVVEMHYKISEAAHYRHKCHKLAGLEVLVDVLGHRAAVASTSNYLLNLIGQYIACEGLVDQCCCLISALLKAFESSQSKEIFWVLGEQLQFLVSKLVQSIIPSEVTGKISSSRLSHVLPLLLRLIVDSDPSLHDYVRELEPLPELDIFDGIRKFHVELCQAYSAREHLLRVVKRSSYIPPRLLLCSVQGLHKKLLLGEISWRERSEKNSAEDILWHKDPETVQAVWTLVHLCCSNDANSIKPLVSDFVSKVGIGDPHDVVFHLPVDSVYTVFKRTITDDNLAEVGMDFDTGISEKLLIAVLKLLEKYLMDESVRIIDIASQALRGILSTEKGQSVLLSLNSFERSLIEIHSKGVNVELVEKLLLDLERRSRVESVPLEEPKLWETCNRTFDAWICPLVYSLIGLSNDVILRLCSDIVLLKAEVAELLLPGVIVDLARKKRGDIALCKLISSQVEEHILTDSNKLTKSIQVFLSALNELRICYVMERSSPASTKRESTKYVKSSTSGSKSRSTSLKVRDSDATSNGLLMSSSWEKVYWLTIDYLIVAKSAIICGSYFTTMMYVEHWCEEYFRELTLGNPDFSHIEVLPEHVEILMSALTRINEPDSLYGIILSHKLTSQVVTYEHEGNWSKALEYYDLQVRSGSTMKRDGGSRLLLEHDHQKTCESRLVSENEIMRKPCKGLIRSLQQIGCTHVLDVYCQGMTSRNSQLQHDLEFCELQHEAAWRAGNWDFLVLPSIANFHEPVQTNHFNENLHSCLRALHEGDFGEFHTKLRGSKQELLSSVSCASEESTEYIYSTVVKLQILYHLGLAWQLRWTRSCGRMGPYPQKQKTLLEPVVPTVVQLSWLNADWRCIWNQTQLHMGLLEPFMAFRRVLLQILGCADYTLEHLLQSASTLRKGCRFSQAAAALQEFKCMCVRKEEQYSSSYWLGRLEEAKLLRAQGQCEIAISLAQFISQNCQSVEETSDVHRLIGKWLAETRSSNSRTILEKHLKPALSLAGNSKTTDKKSVERQSKCHFLLAHYADALFKSYEERLTSSEWQAAMHLRKLKTSELEELIRRLKCSRKEEKEEYSIKIRELQKQLAMDKEEAEKLQDDKDNFLRIALEGYKHCLAIGDKYDVRVVFRLVSLWFSLSSRQDVINNMLSTIDKVQSYKFIPLVYQIASRMGSSKDDMGPHNFQFSLVSLVKKMAIDHPYHTIFQLLALANGDRIKDKQRSRNSFVVDMDKIISAKNLLEELSSYKGAIIKQMKHMVEIYIKLAELETRREDVNKRVALPREIRGIRQLELVPVVTASFPVDRDCCYPEGSFPYFKGVTDSVIVMIGINAPKVVECLGSDGKKYRQLAKSGNDDLRQDAVMEQFFGLVNTFLQKNRDTRRRGLGVRTYKVVPFTPSAGVLEWVSGTLTLGDYLIGSTRNGGAHARYGLGDWSFPICREHMSNEKDKCRAFQEVYKNFRPVMHHFFLERFLQPADWFEKRLAYTRSVAASSMVGYIVGLGDRHSMNILVDQATAEVVHIDLGVAFEQGLMLKTPERVPFRLTRDIIDGMGVTGVEGVFRRCCEETLSVMRTNKEALMTIVEVFIHDPLYKWALSPLKALQRQKETDDDLETNLDDPQEEYEGNKDAARALIRVKQKLDGYEEGELRSVHGQVQQLIQDAIDPERLCQMFPGWGAWL